MNRKTLFFVLILVLILSVSSVMLGQEAEGESIKVGAIFDLTGGTADVGEPYAAGVLAYIDWLNSNGGINGRPLELLSADYEYSVADSESLYTQFVSEGAVVYMGWGTGDSIALKGRVAEDEIPFISASYASDLNDPQGEAPYNFLIATTYGDQMVIMMTYMLEMWVEEGNDPADMKIAMFHHDSPFGTAPLPFGEEFAEEAGIGGTLRIAMPGGATDYTAELQQADDFGVTHIIVQNVTSPAALLATNVVDFFGSMEFVTFGCLNWCADEIFVSLAGDNAEGVFGAIPFTPTTVEVEGQEAPREYLGGQEELEEASLHFTQGWAAMSVMAEAIRMTLDADMELTGANVKASLEMMENYETGGILAPVTFTPEDHRSTRATAIYVVEDGVWAQSSDLIDLRAEEQE